MLLRLLVFVMGVVLVSWAASVALVLLAEARPELREADAIVVLGAAQYNGRPSPVLKSRLDHAIDLYRRGLAPRLVFTGGVGVGDTLSEAEVARRYAISRDVPATAILVERRGLSSAESIGAAAVLMRAHGLQRALIVSDGFHMLRLELLARRAGIHPFRAPTPDSPITSPRARWRFVLRESVLFPATALVGGR